eukprot:scaffold9049_cov105-Isochrysis_galbana.AAC.2
MRRRVAFGEACVWREPPHALRRESLGDDVGRLLGALKRTHVHPHLHERRWTRGGGFGELARRLPAACVLMRRTMCSPPRRALRAAGMQVGRTCASLPEAESGPLRSSAMRRPVASACRRPSGVSCWAASSCGYLSSVGIPGGQGGGQLEWDAARAPSIWCLQVPTFQGWLSGALSNLGGRYKPGHQSRPCLRGWGCARLQSDGVGRRTKVSVADAVRSRERAGQAALLVVLAMADQDDVPRHGAAVGVVEVSALVQRRKLVGRRVADELLHPVRRSVGVVCIQLPDRVGVVEHRILML